MKKYIVLLFALIAGLGSTLMAQTAAPVTPTIDAGDTAWMIVATAMY